MLVLPGQRIHHAPGGATGGVGQEWGAVMTEIEKMKKYIERTKLNISATSPYQANLKEVLAISDLPSFDAVNLAFAYGQAKGYRAAKAEGRARA